MERKLIIVISCFLLSLVVMLWIYQGTAPKADKEKIPLQQALKNIAGWQSGDSAPLDPRIVKALELDDYVDQSYFQGEKRIHLYIGYYRTNKKIGAAHDPLVCFPGQGWVASNIKEKEFPLGPTSSGSVFASVMTVQKGQDKEMIIYWFQSSGRTASGTFEQKINGLRARFSRGPEDNAFVRLSISLQDQSPEEGYRIAHQFIRSFYPVLLTYIES